ncbi:MAG: chemotaxis protein CheB, partial [Granulosicoccus sp.]|nr:chemotaxis protein CheB [Granulosicoccus sp.]
PVVIRTHAFSQAIPKIVCIGVSTGGPDALTRLMMQMPHDLEVPVCIVQHMPREFTGKLAARLDQASAMRVCEAKLGDRLQAGTVYIAPGDCHMVLDRVGPDVFVNLNKNPPENSCRPSVDPLFRSAAAIHGAQCLGVIMTGMGQDGLKGSEVLVAAGSTVLVQDEASCVVWGMPRLVAQAGLAQEQVPLDRLAGAIIARVRSTGRAESESASGNDEGATSAASHDQERLRKRNS